MQVPAMFKTVADLFAPAPLQNPAAPAAAAPQPAGGTAPANPGVQTNTEPMKSPLDATLEVFKLADTNAANNKSPLDAPLFDLDPAKFKERVDQMNFVDVTPELLQKAQSDPAVLAELMNQVARSAYSQAVTLGTRLTEAGLNNRMAGLQQTLPQQIRSEGVRNHLASGEQSKALLHPAVADVVANVQSRFEQAYPTATPAELAGMVTNYFSQVGGALAPKPEPTVQQQQSSAAQDFSGYFGR